MDLKNVVFAIALSFAVLFGWSVIFETSNANRRAKKINKDKDQQIQKMIVLMFLV